RCEDSSRSARSNRRAKLDRSDCADTSGSQHPRKDGWSDRQRHQGAKNGYRVVKLSASDPMWRDDEELIGLMRQRFFSAVIGDVLDSLGLLHQFLPPSIQPLRDDMIVAGRVMPVVGQDLPPCEGGSAPSTPFG